jgi:hypothetical protein
MNSGSGTLTFCAKQHMGNNNPKREISDFISSSNFVKNNNLL